LNDYGIGPVFLHGGESGLEFLATLDPDSVDRVRQKGVAPLARLQKTSARKQAAQKALSAFLRLSTPLASARRWWLALRAPRTASLRE
jgi:hypothetical protein